VPVHKQKFYIEELGYQQAFPESERAAQEVLSLPVHPGLSLQDLETIIARVNEFMISDVSWKITGVTK
jgi:dTDP-4-amino-4,6-dideoxygalactose transaminase